MWFSSILIISTDAYFTGPLGLGWDEGLAWCESQGSTLASITSDAEMAEAVALCEVTGDSEGCTQR